ncbi:MAG TPA: secretin N-terminal domain-containing protein [Chthoniobacteraceae bacterium]|jgi:general secretion pathway protein D|nr:secretin N-terminal domain-containing protein [Chthoniobacteraceae bacterium]
MNKYLPILLTALLAGAVAYAAKPAKPSTVAAPVRVAAQISTPAPAPLLPPPTTPPTPIPPTTPPAVVETVPVPVAPAPTAVETPAPVLPKGVRVPTGPAPASTGVMLNFQNASLNDVLTYLSEAAGFVIVQEAPVTGTVNIVSRQSLNPEEAVDLLNTVLIDKGYTAIRNGRILKIVNRRDAQKKDLPVNWGSVPEAIPRKDNMVIQILPLRYGEAAKLVENLRPLLGDQATISANEGSNAIILTDTQTNIHRMAQIIHALDTSVSALSTITVIPLKFADSKEVAQIITQLFAPVDSGPQGAGGGKGGNGRRGGFPGFGFPGMGGAAPGGGSDARAAAARVVAVADEQSNSVIVSASEDTIPVIRSMIEQIDMSSADVTDTRIFRLMNADATELAGTINSLFGATAGTMSGGGAAKGGNQQGGNNGQRRQGGGAPGAGGAGGAGQSERALLQSQVVAVGDPRTNSLLVTASTDSMAKIAEVVTRLDATGAKRQHVYYHQLQNGDPSSIADVLRGMLGQPTSSNNSGVSVLQNRAVTGSSLNTNVSGGLGSGSGSGSGRSNR